MVLRSWNYNTNNNTNIKSMKKLLLIIIVLLDNTINGQNKPLDSMQMEEIRKSYNKEVVKYIDGELYTPENFACGDLSGIGWLKMINDYPSARYTVQSWIGGGENTALYLESIGWRIPVCVSSEEFNREGENY